LIGYPEVPNY